MLTLSRSRSSSLSVFSQDESISSCTTYTGTEEYYSEKDCSAQMVLKWKPLIMSTAFTSCVSTRLHFTSFPPHDLRKPQFERLSIQAAQGLLNEYTTSSVRSFLSQPGSTVSRVERISFPHSIPQELIQTLQGEDWTYYEVTNNVMPVSIGGWSTSFNHHVAVKQLYDGIERYLFGPAGLCVHSVCRLEDVGAEVDERIARETLFLHEESEIICNKALKWWTRSLIATQITKSHEQFRRDWDESIRGEWSMTKAQKSVDLMA